MVVVSSCARCLKNAYQFFVARRENSANGSAVICLPVAPVRAGLKDLPPKKAGKGGQGGQLRAKADEFAFPAAKKTSGFRIFHVAFDISTSRRAPRPPKCFLTTAEQKERSKGGQSRAKANRVLARFAFSRMPIPRHAVSPFRPFRNPVVKIIPIHWVKVSALSPENFAPTPQTNANKRCNIRKYAQGEIAAKTFGYFAFSDRSPTSG